MSYGRMVGPDPPTASDQVPRRRLTLAERGLGLVLPLALTGGVLGVLVRLLVNVLALVLRSALALDRVTAVTAVVLALGADLAAEARGLVGVTRARAARIDPLAVIVRRIAALGLGAQAVPVRAGVFALETLQALVAVLPVSTEVVLGATGLDMRAAAHVPGPVEAAVGVEVDLLEPDARGRLRIFERLAPRRGLLLGLLPLRGCPAGPVEGV